MYEDEYHPELSEVDIEDFDDGFEDDVDAFFFDEEEFGQQQTAAQQRLAAQQARQAAYVTPQAQQARALRAAEAQAALQTGSGLVQAFTPLIQAGVQQAQADQQRRQQQRQERRRRRATAPPRRSAPPPPQFRPQMGPPPPGYQTRQMPMYGPPMPPGGQGGRLRESDKKLMLYILGGTAVVVAGIGIFALAKK